MKGDIVCISVSDVFELCEKSEFELTYSRSKLASLVSIFKGSVTASL